jgi:hypothetical protein
MRYLVIAAMIYLLVVAAAALVAARTTRLRPWPAIGAAAAALGVFLVVLGLFEAVVLDLRPQRIATRDDFVLLAKLAFAGVYLIVLAAAVGLGRVLGRSWTAAAGAGVVTIGFLTLTFRFVEFLNACNIGEPVLWPSYVEC